MMQTISVGFFKGSLEDPVVSGMNDLVIKIMEAGNVKVTNIKSRTNQETMNMSVDEFDTTLELAMDNIEIYEKYDFDYIVNTNCESGMALKEYDKLFVPGTVWYNRAKSFTDKVRDVSEIMDMANLEFKHEVERNAVYHSPDSSENEQRVFEEPIKIIKQIPGLNYIEMKPDEIQAEKPDLIITSHPGQHPQTKTGIDTNGVPEQIEVRHIVEVVAESCGIASNQ